MKQLSRRGVHVGAIMVLTAAALVVVVLYPGMVIHVVDFHDGGVRVTNGRMAMVAHLSYRSRMLSRGLHTSSMSFGIDQPGSQVAISDTSPDTYTQISDITPPRATGSGSTVLILVFRRFCPWIC